MTKIHKNRLRKLIAFLRVLPRKKFDFGTVYEQQKCGTVGCAIGWTAEVFPRLVEPETGDGVRLKSEEWTEEMDYAEVGVSLFGISLRLASSLFTPEMQDLIHPCLPECGFKSTPKQVATMLEKFLALVESGEVKA